MSVADHDEALLRLADIRGVETGFMDGSGAWIVPQTETLLSILRALGEEIESPAQAGELLRRARLEALANPNPPVVVAWIEKPDTFISARIPLTLPADLSGHLPVSVGFGNEADRSRTLLLEECQSELAFHKDGRNWVRKSAFTLPLPMGVHLLEVRVGLEKPSLVYVIVAPVLAHRNAGTSAGRRDWGVFLPVHAMRSSGNQGCGNFGDLALAMKATADAGGHIFGTLPLLSTFLAPPVVEPSPYAPASRLFWNELYLDHAAIPEFSRSNEARAMVSAAPWIANRNRLADLPLVDQAAVWSHCTPLLDSIAAAFPSDGARRKELDEFLNRKPLAREYAGFRARMDRERQTWPTWNTAGINHDWNDPLYKRYLLCQFWAEQQVSSLARNCRDWGLKGLYLDLPLGVHSDSFDTWRFGSHFAKGVSAGAPPDAFFTLGQDWGFPPLHPRKIRELGHEYFREVIQFHTAASAMLRIDHVMGMFRLYWIPWGMGPKSGAYVRYPAEELLALTCIASATNQCALVGEDLGTVPPAVRPAMKSHGIDRLYVAQFSVHDSAPVLEAPPVDSIACVNTHDLPPFAAFWSGSDIDDRLDLGLFEIDQAKSEHSYRRKLREALAGELGIEIPSVEEGRDGTLDLDPTAVLGVMVKRLLEKPSRGLLINMEDLWGAVDPQNVPGTWKERPNWRRKAIVSLDELSQTKAWNSLMEWFTPVSPGAAGKNC